MELFLFQLFLLALIAFTIKNLPEIIRLFSRSRPGNNHQQNFPYIKKNYLLTEAEHRFFIALQKTISDQYYIFPQIHLANLLYIPKGTRNWQSYFNRIIQKSVDFVICDKEYLSPLLAIELNDNSHNLPNRVERDYFVDTALREGGLPILSVLTLSNQDYYDIEKLKYEIQKFIELI